MKPLDSILRQVYAAGFAPRHGETGHLVVCACGCQNVELQIARPIKDGYEVRHIEIAVKARGRSLPRN